MSQTLLRLASLQSRRDAATDTLAEYQALLVAHHQMEEATYNSGELAVEEVVAQAASLDPVPKVIHIDLRLGGRLGPRICGGNSASGFPPFVFCTFSPSPPPWTNC